jgi:hypothetical protein
MRRTQFANVSIDWNIPLERVRDFMRDQHVVQWQHIVREEYGRGVAKRTVIPRNVERALETELPD